MARTMVAITAGFLILAGTGCAAFQRSNAMDTERLLAAAGFRMNLANTPDRMAEAETLPQRKLTTVAHSDGSPRWVYADAKFCKCLYVGSDKAYDRFQKLSVKTQVAEEEEDASLNWGAWGPWW